MRRSRCITAVASLVATSTLAAAADEWRNRTIYQLLTDRFATSDNSSPTCNTSDRKYCGGTWQGIIDKLDYIQDMGFDAVWISPIVTNIEGNTAYGEAFHGYWPQDINSLNSNFGSADDVKALSSALHEGGMYFMVDVVVNHLASDLDPPDYSQFSPFSTQANFHPECFISDYNNQTDVEQCWLGDGNLPLADVDTENAGIVTSLNSWIQSLVSEYGVDGIRIDTVKHIRKDFWPDFAKSAGVFTLGEVLHSDVNYVAPYTEVLDSVLDYPTWFSLVPAFQKNGNLTAFAAVVHEAQTAYKAGEMMTGSFLDNHDQPRFRSLTQDDALVRNAMAWPFVQDGIPIVYYGQEQGYQGGADPANREALWLSGYSEGAPLVQYIKTLNAVRRAATAFNSQYLTTPVRLPATVFSPGPWVLAVSKPPMLALLTNVGNASNTTWDVPDAGYQPNAALVDVLSCTSLSADDRGGVSAQSTSGDPKILMPAVALSKNGSLCPDLAASSGQSSGSSGGGVPSGSESPPDPKSSSATFGACLRTNAVMIAALGLGVLIWIINSLT
ncbi:glycoside hydrolase family 13 protein [Daedaleopsis nitida]|nr:glycoside hydrolase family 13 protein [Daedaleopsis nitida]